MADDNRAPLPPPQARTWNDEMADEAASEIIDLVLDCAEEKRPTERVAARLKEYVKTLWAASAPQEAGVTIQEKFDLRDSGLEAAAILVECHGENDLAAAIRELKWASVQRAASERGVPLEETKND